MKTNQEAHDEDFLKPIAQRRFHEATSKGKIKRPKTCSRCGAKRRYILGHHEDHMAPYDVIWLCGMCHSRRHRAKRYIKEKGLIEASNFSNSDYSIDDIFDMLGFSKRSLIEYMKKNSIDVYSDGWDMFVSANGFDEFLKTFIKENKRNTK